MNELLVNRLNEAIDFLKSEKIIKTQKDIADIMGMNINSISQALNGNEKYLTDSFLKKFSLSFNSINFSWLKGEDQTMIVSESTLSRIPSDEEIQKCIENLILHEELFKKFDSYNTFIKNKENEVENRVLKEIIKEKLNK